MFGISELDFEFLFIRHLKKIISIFRQGAPLIFFHHHKQNVCVKIPGMLSLGSGEPNSETFPFSKISFQLKNGTEVSLSEEETNQALQYTITSGLPSLVSWGKEFQQREHSPQYSDWDVCFG